MEQQLWYRWAKVYAVGFAISGSGFLLYKYATPTDEQLINSLSPELRAQYEKERSLRRKEQEELMKIVKKTAASNDPIWMTGPLQSPFEQQREGIDGAFQLKDKIEREDADRKQLEEIEKVRRELEEAQAKTRAATDEHLKKRTWFSWR